MHPSKHAVLQYPTSSKLGKCSLQLQRLHVVLSMLANIIVQSFKTAICLCLLTRLFARIRISVPARPGNKFNLTDNESRRFSPAVVAGTLQRSAKREYAVDKLVGTLKEANKMEQQRFDNEKQLHNTKLAESQLKNVNAILCNPPVGLNQA